jgi:hypothetical protein
VKDFLTQLNKGSTVNKTHYVEQVDGTHYGRKYGHWDLCKAVNASYLEGCASKYVFRWRSKAGVIDLKKSLSYLNKLMIGNVSTVVNRGLDYYSLMSRFFIENEVGSDERTLIELLLFWNDYNDLIDAHTILSAMIIREEDLIPTAKDPK